MSNATMTDKTFARLSTGWDAHQRHEADAAEKKRGASEGERQHGHGGGRAWAENTVDYDLLDKLHQAHIDRDSIRDPHHSARDWAVAKATGRLWFSINAHFAAGFVAGVGEVMTALFERQKATN